MHGRSCQRVSVSPAGGSEEHAVCHRLSVRRDGRHTRCAASGARGRLSRLPRDLQCGRKLAGSRDRFHPDDARRSGDRRCVDEGVHDAASGARASDGGLGEIPWYEGRGGRGSRQAARRATGADRADSGAGTRGTSCETAGRRERAARSPPTCGGPAPRGGRRGNPNSRTERTNSRSGSCDPPVCE